MEHYNKAKYSATTVLLSVRLMADLSHQTILVDLIRTHTPIGLPYIKVTEACDYYKHLWWSGPEVRKMPK